MGEHRVSFFHDGEQVHLSHVAESRDQFVRGALCAGRWLMGREPDLCHRRDRRLMARVFLGLGGNVGKVPEVFRQSLESLESQGYVRVIHTSSLWRSPSWGFVGPDFYNAVAEIETDAEPRELLKVLLQEEQQRRASPRRPHGGSPGGFGYFELRDVRSTNRV